MNHASNRPLSGPTPHKSVRVVAVCAGALAFIGLIGNSLAATATDRNTAPEATNKALMPLGSGDIVTLQVYGRPELSTTASIAEDGTLSAPLVGAVQVAGLSTTAAAQAVANAFKKGQYLRNPQVSILVTQSRSQLVSVLGEVKTPGRFAVDSRMTVLDLLAQAGGMTERSGSVLYVIRPTGNGVDRRPVDLRGLQSDQYALQVLTLQGGDSVFVPAAEQFYIYGQVQSPNSYRLEPNMTVLQAISRSGGLTRVASGSRIEIKRRNEAGQLVARKAALDERIQPDDIIYVKESIF